jgi:hypothetical protein
MSYGGILSSLPDIVVLHCYSVMHIIGECVFLVQMVFACTSLESFHLQSCRTLSDLLGSINRFC